MLPTTRRLPFAGLDQGGRVHIAISCVSRIFMPDTERDCRRRSLVLGFAEFVCLTHALRSLLSWAIILTIQLNWLLKSRLACLI